MTTKKFLVQFTSDPSTKWLQGDDFIALQLKFIATSLGASVTTGSEPAVDVCKDESQPELSFSSGGCACGSCASCCAR